VNQESKQFRVSKAAMVLSMSPDTKARVCKSVSRVFSQITYVIVTYELQLVEIIWKPEPL